MKLQDAAARSWGSGFYALDLHHPDCTHVTFHTWPLHAISSWPQSPYPAFAAALDHFQRLPSVLVDTHCSAVQSTCPLTSSVLTIPFRFHSLTSFRVWTQKHHPYHTQLRYYRHLLM